MCVYIYVHKISEDKFGGCKKSFSWLRVKAESVKGRDVTQPVAFWILNWWRTKRLGVMRVHKQTGVLSFIWLKSDRLLVR